MAKNTVLGLNRMCEVLILFFFQANDADSGKFGKAGIRYSLIGSGENL